MPLGSLHIRPYSRRRPCPAPVRCRHRRPAQGGPGCASSFGNLYELGPMLVTPSLELEPNPGKTAPDPRPAASTARACESS